jgi:hypothetical protein
VAIEAGVGVAIPGKAGVVSCRTLLVKTATTLVDAVAADLKSVGIDEFIAIIAIDEPAITTFCGIPIFISIGAAGVSTTL